MFTQIRHRPPTPLTQPRELVVVVAPMRSRVNLARIVRMAGCSGLTRLIACENPKVDPEIARDAVEQVRIESRRTLPPVLRSLREEGFQIVGLEQTTNSRTLHGFPFVRRTALVIGRERDGLTEEELALCDEVAEIPVYGKPHAYNAATAACLAMYEYCRHFPHG